MERIFRKELKVEFNECDFTGKAKLSSVLKYLADIAGDDYADRGKNHEYLWNKGIVFLLSKVSVTFVGAIKAEEKIIIETNERCVKSAYFYRDYVITDADNNPLVYAKSAWIVCNPDTRRLIRPSAVGFEIDGFDRRIPCLEPTKIAAAELGENVGIRKIVYSDLDCNHHVYNAVYADIASDYLPFEIFSKTFKTFEINFERESHYGDELTIYREVSNNGATVQGIKEDGLSFICRLTY